MAEPITGQGISAYPLPDAALSNTSKNPVQNKVITEELSQLNAALTDLNRQISDLHQVVTITLTAAGWASNQQVAAVTGVLADVTKQMISPIPAPASETAYVAAGVMAISQAADALTFRCIRVPTADLTVYVFIDEVVTAS